MFNYDAIDTVPTVNEIKAIIEYMSNDDKYNFNMMMDMAKTTPNTIRLSLNNGHCGTDYTIRIDDSGNIHSFSTGASWIS